MTYENIQKTIYKLLNLREYLAFPQNWRQSDNLYENASTLSEAFHAVGVEHSAYQQYLDEDNAYPSDLNRGEIPEPIWFVRQAMNKVAPEFGGLIYKWNDAPGRTHEEVLDLTTSAIDLAKNELTQILSSDDTFDMSDIILHRWALERWNSLKMVWRQCHQFASRLHKSTTWAGHNSTVSTIQKVA